ncbi:Exosome complex component RRP41-like protein [Nymphaea thermarum]|nr:Exosome complex component RRP41-like protein [Nymphaea thermarum]
MVKGRRTGRGGNFSREGEEENMRQERGRGAVEGGRGSRGRETELTHAAAVATAAAAVVVAGPATACTTFVSFFSALVVNTQEIDERKEGKAREKSPRVWLFHAKGSGPDLNHIEDSAGGPDVTVGVLAKLEKVTLLQVPTKISSIPNLFAMSTLLGRTRSSHRSTANIGRLFFPFSFTREHHSLLFSFNLGIDIFNTK